MKKKSFFKPIKFLFLVICVLLFVLILWWKWATGAVSPNSTAAQIFIIPQGQAIDTIGKRLKEQGLIKSPAAFKILVITKHLATKIQAGDFRLRPSMNLNTLAVELTQGSIDIWVTLLEGWRREEMAQKIYQEFIKQDIEFDILTFLSQTKDSEGYLFPDTYLFPRNADAQTIASTLKNTFNQKVDLSNNNSDLSSKQVMILASILEREVRTDKDRPIIAGILIKRLQNDWPLQADATVQYIVGSKKCQQTSTECDWWPKSLTKQDLQINSAYNTYKNQGLPPAPIANPGLKSIEAALNPQASEYWFYLSDLKGNIHYAETIEEHNDNIAKYL